MVGRVSRFGVHIHIPWLLRPSPLDWQSADEDCGGGQGGGAEDSGAAARLGEGKASQGQYLYRL